MIDNEKFEAAFKDWEIAKYDNWLNTDISNATYMTPRKRVEWFHETYEIALERTRRKPELLDAIIYEANDSHNDSIIDMNTYYKVIPYDSLTPVVMLPDEKFCVLNFANPVTPGGGVLGGALAQEEDICRKSTLYCALTSHEARRYYLDHNVMLDMGDDRVFTSRCMYHPHVELVRNNDGSDIEFSAITCAAPILYTGDYDEDEYAEIFRERIYTILNCANDNGEKNLVLGAFGCGAFGNDPALVARIFREALFHYEFDGVIFAIKPAFGPHNASLDKNYHEFHAIIKQQH